MGLAPDTVPGDRSSVRGAVVRVKRRLYALAAGCPAMQLGKYRLVVNMAAAVARVLSFSRNAKVLVSPSRLSAVPAHRYGLDVSSTGEVITHTGQVNKNFAIKMVAEEPVTDIGARVVSCDGGGGALGHPKVYINLGQIPPNGVSQTSKHWVRHCPTCAATHCGVITSYGPGSRPPCRTAVEGLARVSRRRRRSEKVRKFQGNFEFTLKTSEHLFVITRENRFNVEH
ncbi:hypothetical protein F2P81_001273 [Scophthalmus maximus]|uniref:Zinc finger CHCC-type domain-containing protein n=1 Tax=Scophthalmus maximus TaxID=52904 RepID=A0A6A4TVD4_SCOMX|nr:hypothetical protein F2P81_001273 [Scophthalmus maximus]